MKVVLRLYKRFDIDLISLASQEDFSFTKIAKTVLKSYVRGKSYHIDMPKAPNKVAYENMNSITEYIFRLNDETDKDVIELLSKIRDRQRNSFIKNLVRGYMVGPNLSSYFYDESDCIDIIDSFKRENVEIVEPFAKPGVNPKPKKVKEKANKKAKKVENNQNLDYDSSIAKPTDKEDNIKEISIAENGTNKEIINISNEKQDITTNNTEEDISSISLLSSDDTNINEYNEDIEQEDMYDQMLLNF